MEVKSESSLPVALGQPSASVSGESDNGPLLAASPKYSDNFFSFDGERDEVWGPNFTKSLRKTRCVTALN